MIQPFNSIRFSQLMVITLLMHLLTHLKFILMVKDFCWSQVRKLSKLFQERGSTYHQDHHQDYAEADNDEEIRPSPSLVPVPSMSHVVSTLIKTRLPVVEFSRSKLQGIGAQQPAVCAICLACIKGSEEIRELANCSHVYHRECVDGWVDQGHGTCPLCRLKLLPCQAEDEAAKGEKDPWRLERIAYLFGDEDYCM